MSMQPTQPFMLSPDDARSWGPWRLDSDTTRLVFHDPVVQIAVPLLTCTNCAAVVDWCMHMLRLGWGEVPTAISGLLVAIDDVLHLQDTLCSNARSGIPGKELEATEIMQRVNAFVDAPGNHHHIATPVNVLTSLSAQSRESGVR